VFAAATKFGNPRREGVVQKNVKTDLGWKGLRGDIAKLGEFFGKESPKVGARGRGPVARKKKAETGARPPDVFLGKDHCELVFPTSGVSARRSRGRGIADPAKPEITGRHGDSPFASVVRKVGQKGGRGDAASKVEHSANTLPAKGWKKGLGKLASGRSREAGILAPNSRDFIAGAWTWEGGDLSEPEKKKEMGRSHQKATFGGVPVRPMPWGRKKEVKRVSRTLIKDGVFFRGS